MGTACPSKIGTVNNGGGGGGAEHTMQKLDAISIPYNEKFPQFATMRVYRMD